MAMQFGLRAGCRIRTDPQVVGEVCNQLENEGKLTAKNLVDVSRPINAPLHNEFEWDNDKAAEKYREEQARHIIASVVIITEKREPQRMFFNIKRAEPQYKAVTKIVQNPVDLDALYETALRELIAIKNKYKQVKELYDVFSAIDGAVSTYNKTLGKRKNSSDQRIGE